MIVLPAMSRQTASWHAIMDVHERLGDGWTSDRRTIAQTLIDLGFASQGISAEGTQHRWVQDDAVIDVLLPDGIGERKASRKGATGSRRCGDRPPPQ